MTDRASWDETWMRVADAVALRSRCVRGGVGAVIVDPTQRIVATGFNGPPAGYPADGMCGGFCPRARVDEADLDPGYTDCVSIHAETNALLFCDRREREGGSIYVTGAICLTCAKTIANSGLSRAVMRVGAGEGYRDPARVKRFLVNCGLGVDRWDD